MSGPNQYALRGSAAEKYERNMVPAIFAVFARDLLEFAELQQGERVLDVACGTGIVARLAWPQVAPSGQIAGLDLNRDMLEVARAALPEAGGNIRWSEGNVTAMPFDNGAFDVVLCQHGLQYFPDAPGALREMHRVLAATGRLVLNVFRSLALNVGHLAVAIALQRRVSEEAAATRRAPFKLADREQVRALVQGAGFHDVTIRMTTRVTRFASADAMVRMMIEGTPLGAVMNDDNPELLGAVIGDVASALADYEDDRGLAIPMQAWVVTARA